MFAPEKGGEGQPVASGDAEYNPKGQPAGLQQNLLR